jgi:hypothetical protein
MAEMEEKYDLSSDALMEGYGEEGEETDSSSGAEEESTGDESEAY